MLTRAPIEGRADELRLALEGSGLPVGDIAEPGRIFFRFEENGVPVGYGGYELHGREALLRSVVVLPGNRGIGLGREVSEAVLAEARAAGADRAYLLTETAKGFFEHLGFAAIARDSAPEEILATRQAQTICATAALLMRRIDD